MTPKFTESTQAIQLRRRAEVRVRKPNRNRPTKLTEPLPDGEALRLVHQLQVHQVELELQNAELREARDRIEHLLVGYTDLYDFAPVGYLTLGIDGAIRMVNLTAATLVDTERARLVGRALGSFIALPFRTVFTAFLKQVFASESKLSADFELLRTGQPARIVNVEAQRLLKGQECRVAMVDITERKQAEELVRISEIRYRRLFEAAQDGVLILDPITSEITEANPFMSRLLGYTHEELLGKELYEIGLLKDEAASREMFRKLKKTREVRYEDLPLESENGKRKEVEVVANLYQENGHSVIQCNVRDISVRKKAENTLRQNESLFCALVAQAPVGVYVVDAELRLKQINPRARSVFEGVKPLVGRAFAEIAHIIWPRRVAEEILKRFRQTLKTGVTYQSPEFTERRKDTGLMESYEWQIERITLPGSGYGVVCFFSNTTEKRQAEAAQRRLDVLAASNSKLEQEIVRRQAVEVDLTQSKDRQNRLLAESQQMQEQLRELSRQVLRAQEEERKLISRDLHDVIAQTLTSINVRLAALKKAAALGRRGLARTITKTQRLVEKSVETVHQFARDLRPAVLDDLGLIPALHSFMKSYLERTGVRVRLTAFLGVEEIDGAKRTVLYRIAQEALTNVAKHAQASRVDVTIQKLAGTVCMTIQDNGKSFPVDQILGSGKNRRLGLLGMRERVEMVGGTLRIESALGKGTLIQAQMPITQRGLPAKNTKTAKIRTP